MKELNTIKYKVWDEKMRCWDNSSYYPLYPNQKLVSQGRIFLQYTGIKDVNSKEVYQGDIVIIANAIKGIVTWDDCRWVVVNMKSNISHPLTKLDKVEVIGNEYET